MNLFESLDTAAAKPRDAAAVVLLRGDSDPEVLLVERSNTMRFMPGHHVFPGGRVDPGDAQVPTVNSEGTENLRFLVAAARECFEETGILLATGPHPNAETLAEARRAVLSGNVDFATVLTRHQLQIDASRFTPIGLWVTPPISPIRFYTRFFLYRADDVGEATAIPEDGEITSTEWIRPDKAREDWHRNTRKLSAPVAYVLQQLAALNPEAALPWLNAVPAGEDGVARSFEFRRGIHLVPLASPTILPATHTNTLLIGERELIVVDPGPESDSERKRLLDRIRHMEALGSQLQAIVLSHSHVDHVAGVGWLREQRQVPVWAHEATAAQVDFPVDRLLADGERIVLAGSPGWDLECLHTPGHDPGHLALLERQTQTLIAGDLLANPGTIVISPDWQGDMTDYLASLERCAGLNFTLLIPGHGLPTFGRAGQKVFVNLVAHRLERETRIKQALDQGADTMTRLLEVAYADVGEESWPLATHQARAHLIRLGVTLP